MARVQLNFTTISGSAGLVTKSSKLFDTDSPIDTAAVDSPLCEIEWDDGGEETYHVWYCGKKVLESGYATNTCASYPAERVESVCCSINSEEGRICAPLAIPCEIAARRHLMGYTRPHARQ